MIKIKSNRVPVAASETEHLTGFRRGAVKILELVLIDKGPPRNCLLSQEGALVELLLTELKLVEDKRIGLEEGRAPIAISIARLSLNLRTGVEFGR